MFYFEEADRLIFEKKDLEKIYQGVKQEIKKETDKKLKSESVSQAKIKYGKFFRDIPSFLEGIFFDKKKNCRFGIESLMKLLGALYRKEGIEKIVKNEEGTIIVGIFKGRFFSSEVIEKEINDLKKSMITYCCKQSFSENLLLDQRRRLSLDVKSAKEIGTLLKAILARQNSTFSEETFTFQGEIINFVVTNKKAASI